MTIQWVQLTIFIILFALVTVLGFVASRWKAGANLDHLYAAYTFVAVPALVFSAGALGMYALPYTIVVYPIVLLPALRMWSVSRSRGYVTPADFVRGRFGSPILALLIAITGIVATMPYIALQLVGLE